jgi:hypothetical protein
MSSRRQIVLAVAAALVALAFLAWLRGGAEPPEHASRPRAAAPALASSPQTPAPKHEAEAPENAPDDGAAGEDAPATRDFPSSIRAGRMAAPWTAIRRALISSPDPGDARLVEDIYTLILHLREQRRAPSEAGWRAVDAEMAALQERLPSSPRASDPTIQSALEQVAEIRAQASAPP